MIPVSLKFPTEAGWLSRAGWLSNRGWTGGVAESTGGEGEPGNPPPMTDFGIYTLESYTPAAYDVGTELPP